MEHSYWYIVDVNVGPLSVRCTLDLGRKDTEDEGDEEANGHATADMIYTQFGHLVVVLTELVLGTGKVARVCAISPAHAGHEMVWSR
jgi:hypothetical protein